MIGRWRLGLAVAPLALLSGTLHAQSFNPELAPPFRVTGFSTSLAVQGEEIFVGRTGLSVTLPLLSSQTGGVHVFRRDPRSPEDVDDPRTTVAGRSSHQGIVPTQRYRTSQAIAHGPVTHH